MDQSTITRSNAKIILKAARGKSKAEREIFYAWLRLGPWSFMVPAIGSYLAQLHKPSDPETYLVDWYERPALGKVGH